MFKKTYIYIIIAFLGGIMLSFGYYTFINKNQNSNHQSTTNHQQITTTSTIQPQYKSKNKNLENSTQTHQLTRKCTPSYNYKKNFGVNVCVILPSNWQQQALGYEDHLVFKEDIYATAVSPTLSINRRDTSNYQTFNEYLSKNNKALLEKYNGNIIAEDRGSNYYYLEAELSYGYQKVHAFAYYYNDQSHNYFWSATLMLTPEKYNEYKQIGPTIVKSLEIH